MAQEQRPNCANFLDQDDAQVAYAADPTDPFGLDEQGTGDGEACEQPEDEFGTPPLTGCDDLQGHPEIAQALYDHALRKYGSDRYDLAACIAQESPTETPAPVDVSAEDPQGETPDVLDGPFPNAEDGGVVVTAAAIGTGETLEAALEARFTELEERFVAFEARAANGFGRFPDTDDAAPGSTQAAAVTVSTFRQGAARDERGSRNDGGLVVRAQKAKDGHGNRAKERAGKRDRPTGKQRHRSER
jgi:hypothetical protein